MTDKERKAKELLKVTECLTEGFHKKPNIKPTGQIMESEHFDVCAVEVLSNGQQQICTPDDLVKFQLKELIESTPNNSDLGAEIRKLYS